MEDVGTENSQANPTMRMGLVRQRASVKTRAEETLDVRGEWASVMPSLLRLHEGCLT